MADTLQTWRSGGASEKAGVTHINLRNIYDPKPAAKPAVRIRPPPPRPPAPKPSVSKPEPSAEPAAKPIMRRRAKSLSLCPADARAQRRSPQVRFVDALGLELEEVKVFRVQDHPLVPDHVMFRLMMSSELAFRKSLELSLPYFKPCFPSELRTGSAHSLDFAGRLQSQRVCLERVQCSDDRITGTICVLNLSYEKRVSVVYSFTNWRTQTDTSASWASSGDAWDPVTPGADVFWFRLPVPPFILEPGAVLEFAVRYSVNGRDFWDNNDGQNYRLSCHSYKVTVPKECEDSMLHFT